MAIQNLVFMGSPQFSVPTLETLLSLFPDTTLSVISQPDKPKGRHGTPTPTPIKSLATSQQIQVFTPPTKQALQDQVFSIKPDLIIVIAYGMILPKPITDTFFCVNIHASILPQYRGASPIHSSLLNHDTETGITLIKMDEGMDSGPILMIQKCPITDTDNLGSLSETLSLLGAKTLRVWIQTQYLTQSYTLTHQDHDQATFCHKLSSKDQELLSTESAYQWFLKIRAFSPAPGAFVIHQNKRIKVLSATYTDPTLNILTVQPEGKKPMSYHDYCLGTPDGIPIPC